MSSDTAFNKIEPAMHGQELAACPLCGSPSEMWERAENGTAAKTVCCSHGEPLASMPDAGIVSSGCPLYMPPESFYQATYREAARIWNTAAAEFVQMRAAAGSDKPPYRIPPLNETVAEILGRPNFKCAHIARILRVGGAFIAPRAEAEQAAVIHFLLEQYVEHGDDWFEKASGTLRAMDKRGNRNEGDPT